MYTEWSSYVDDREFVGGCTLCGDRVDVVWRFIWSGERFRYFFGLEGKEVRLFASFFFFCVFRLFVLYIVFGFDIWDRFICFWESFLEEGLSSLDDIYGNTCYILVIGYFFCKRCKNFYGYYFMKLRGKVRG